MTLIRNPILPGFNPDPSICRVGDDSYIATSTFEWFPGVQIHHSRDLVNWRLATRPLDRRSQLDLIGVPDSGGIWAPCLTWARGRFWLIYTNVQHMDGAFKDTPNYLVTAERIEGPWSEPVYLNSSGFDPSLFHDDDGRMWFVNQLWDHRPDATTRFAGIVLQEFDPQAQRLTGPITNIFAGSNLGITEGPHLLKKDGWYYLLTAEGGTDWHHAVSLARSRSITGPYELHPDNPILTSRGTSARLQKAGHGSLVQAGDGSWWMAHLASRPMIPGDRCMLGRETSLQPVVWGADGWPRLAHGGRTPAEVVPAPHLPAHPWPAEPVITRLSGPTLPPAFQTLRRPADPSWLSFTSRGLRLAGGESPISRFRQSLVARRLTAFAASVATEIHADPVDFQQSAGLTAIYDTRTWFALRLTWRADRGRCLLPTWCDDGKYGEDATGAVAVAAGPVQVGLDIARGRLRFRFRQGDRPWTAIGAEQDATKLSDDYGTGWHFTGAFVGLSVVDLSGRAMPAEFPWFSYEEPAE
jgi:xylan 1,4-beta-xylosidase